jgi:hypothetical protein
MRPSQLLGRDFDLLSRANNSQIDVLSQGFDNKVQANKVNNQFVYSAWGVQGVGSMIGIVSMVAMAIAQPLRSPLANWGVPLIATLGFLALSSAAICAFSAVIDPELDKAGFDYSKGERYLVGAIGASAAVDVSRSTAFASIIASLVRPSHVSVYHR